MPGEMKGATVRLYYIVLDTVIAFLVRTAIILQAFQRIFERVGIGGRRFSLEVHLRDYAYVPNKISVRSRVFRCLLAVVRPFGGSGRSTRFVRAQD
jgi:hypothetical protein